METLEPIVSALPLFKGLKPEHIQIITRCAANAHYEAGTFLGRSGGEADRFWIIRQGRVALQIHAAGRGPLTVQTLGDDEVVGWSWLVPPHQLRFDIHAVTSTRVLAVDGKALRARFASDPELGFELLQRFSQVILRRLDAISIQLLDLYGDFEGGHE